MRRTEAQLPPPTIEVNPAYSNIRACTGAYFCDQASRRTKQLIAKTAGTSLKTVTQEGTFQGPGILQQRAENGQGTGSAYLNLLEQRLIKINRNTGHAEISRLVNPK